MDISLLVFLGIVGIAAFRGYKSGLLIISSRIVSLILAYVCAYLLAKPAGQFIQSILPLSGLLAYAAGGLLVFIVVSSITSIVFSIIIKQLAPDDLSGSLVSSISGAILGAMIGSLIGIMCIWFYLTIVDISNSKQGLPSIKVTDFQQTTKNITGSAVKTIVQGITQKKDVAAASAALLTDPGKNIRHIKNLNESGKFERMIKSPSMQQALSSNNVNQVIQQVEFQQLIKQADFLALAKELALTDKPEELEQAIAVKITTVWKQIESIKYDPEFQQLLNDPDLKQQVQSKDFFAMLNNSKVEALVELISRVEVASPSFEPVYSTFDNQQNKTDKYQSTSQQSNSKLYRWVDKKGQVHYSDKDESEQD